MHSNGTYNFGTVFKVAPSDIFLILFTLVRNNRLPRQELGDRYFGYIGGQ